jgi:hypothetical protein
MEKVRSRAVLPTLLIGAIMACARPSYPPPSPAPKPPISVEWVNDSVWHYCELSISLPEAGQGTYSSACRGEDGFLIAGGGALSTAEGYGLRRLIADAALFGDSSQGEDLRGLDFPFITLRVTEGQRVTEVVCSRNPTFTQGVRQQLFHALWALERRTGSGA